MLSRIRCPHLATERPDPRASADLCADFAFRVTNILTEPRMPTAKRTGGGRKRASSARKGRGARSGSRAGSSGRSKSPRSRAGASRKRSTGARKRAMRPVRAKKRASKKGSSRGSARRSSARKSAGRGSSAVARVKRVATGVVHQAAGLGERAVESVTGFVQDRF